MTESPRARLSLPVAAALAALAWALGRALLAGAAAVETVARGAAFGEALEAVERDLLVTGTAHALGLVVAIALAVRLIHGPDAEARPALGVLPVPGRIPALALVAGLALAIPTREAVNLLVELAPSLTPDFATQGAALRAVQIRDLGDAIVVPLSVVVVPAGLEELLYRGALQPALGRRYGPVMGWIGASMLFGLSHLTPLAIVYATALGLVLGRLRDRHGSVMPAIALHGGFNAAPILLDPAYVRIEGFNTVGDAHVALPWVLGSAAIAAVALTALDRTDERADDGG